MQTRFPIIKEDGKEFQDIDELRTLLKQETSGSYLLGKSNLWHGGIHISSETAPWCRKTWPIRAIADGKVVAYRITDDYQESTYKGVTGKFSNNFCLIEHQYKEVNPDDRTKSNEFTFYSLYMHLAPKQDSPNATRYKLNSNRNVRELDSQTHKMKAAYTTLVAGTLFQKSGNTEALTATIIGKTTSYTWHKIEILSGPSRGEEKWIAWTDGKINGKDIIEAVACDKPDWFVEANTGTLHVLAEPENISAGDTIGFLGQHDTVRRVEEGINTKYQVHLEVFSQDYTNLAKTLRNDAEIKQGITYLKIPKEQTYHKKIAYKKATVDEVVKHTEPTLNNATSKYTVNSSLTTYTGKIAYKVNECREGENGHNYADCMLINDNDTNSGNRAWLAITRRYLHDPSNTFLFESVSGKNLEEALLKSPNIIKDLYNKEWVEVETDKYVKVNDSYKFTNHDWLELGYSQVEGLLGWPTERVLTEKQLPSLLFRRMVRAIDADVGKARDITKTVVRNTLEYQTNWKGVEKIIANCKSEWCETESTDSINFLNDKANTPLAADELQAHIEHENARAQALEWIKQARANNLRISDSLWHFHPLGFMENIKPKNIINVDNFMRLYNNDFGNMNNTSKENLINILNEINLFYFSSNEAPSKKHLSYMLATARHEAFYFITNEYFSSKPEIGNIDYFNKYDCILADTEQRKIRARNNGNTVEGDGYKYRGRGLVHLTWKNNYQQVTDHFGVDFISNPVLASEIKHSVRIMIYGMNNGVFTGYKLSDFINESQVDYLGARKIINGTDQQDKIAGYAVKFETILSSSSTL